MVVGIALRLAQDACPITAPAIDSDGVSADGNRPAIDSPGSGRTDGASIQDGKIARSHRQDTFKPHFLRYLTQRHHPDVPALRGN